MILREFFNQEDPITDNGRYNGENDVSTLNRSDTRKTRLTLKQINQLRHSTELHILEQEAELKIVQQMYMNSAAPPM